MMYRVVHEKEKGAKNLAVISVAKKFYKHPVFLSQTATPPMSQLNFTFLLMD